MEKWVFSCSHIQTCATFYYMSLVISYVESAHLISIPSNLSILFPSNINIILPCLNYFLEFLLTSYRLYMYLTHFSYFHKSWIIYSYQFIHDITHFIPMLVLVNQLIFSICTNAFPKFHNTHVPILILKKFITHLYKDLLYYIPLHLKPLTLWIHVYSQERNYITFNFRSSSYGL